MIIVDRSVIVSIDEFDGEFEVNVSPPAFEANACGLRIKKATFLGVFQSVIDAKKEAINFCNSKGYEIKEFCLE